MQSSEDQAVASSAKSPANEASRGVMHAIACGAFGAVVHAETHGGSTGFGTGQRGGGGGGASICTAARFGCGSTSG